MGIESCRGCFNKHIQIQDKLIINYAIQTQCQTNIIFKI